MNGINTQGALNLVIAIVQRASNDVVNRSLDSLIRHDAETFFHSDYFAVLTGMNGAPILKRLQARAALKKRSKRRKTRKEDPL